MLRVRPYLVFLAASILFGCGPAPTPQSPAARLDDAPPVGASHDDFLKSLRPTRPDDTDEADKMVLHVIDIGQGLALLLEFPCGAVLVDTGGESNEQFDSTEALHKYLEAFFERRTDLGRTFSALYVTHPHIDHTRGIDYVISSYRVERVITNGQEFDDLGGGPQTELHRWARKRALRSRSNFKWTTVDTVRLPPRGITNEIVDPVGACKASETDPLLTALWGQVNDEEVYSDNANDHSVVLRIDYGKSSVLITGDLEFEGLDHLSKRYRGNSDLLDVDVYVVGHHGSRNATSPELLRAMTPKIAVISAGPYSRNLPWTARKYGHPNVEAIDKLRHASTGVSWSRDSKNVWIGVKGAWKERPSSFKQEAVNRAIYSTSWDGTITTKLYDNGWIEVETER